MQLLALFLQILLLITTGFRVCRALDCKLNIYSSKVANTLKVDQSGKGMYTKIQQAIDAIPSGNDQWIFIDVNPGIYREKVTIPREKQCIILQGSSNGQTTIVYDDHDATDTSATFTAYPDNFVARFITFANSYNRGLKLTDDKLRAPALAARFYGDKSAFQQCQFLGFQDTLWDVSGRHYFNSCYIEGAVDFIWGDAQSFYEGCSINATAGLLPPKFTAGYVTAQARKASDDPSGFVFKGGSLFGSGHMYLGRALGPFSRVIFYGTTLSEVVVPLGWDARNYTGHEANFTYAEVKCGGSGADTSKRVPWESKNITDPENQGFSRSAFIDQDQWLSKIPSSSKP